MVALFCFFSLALASVVPKVTREFLFPPNTFPYCHVCSISQSADGNLFATYQAGTEEAAPDQKIWSSFRDMKQTQWNSPNVAIERDGICVMNAVQYRSTDDTIYLMYHSGTSEIAPLKPGYCSTHHWKGYFSASEDNGQTWGSNSTFPGCDACNETDTMENCCLGSVKNNCIMMSNGQVICPSSNEAVLDGTIGIWTGHFELTDDIFSKWKRTHSVDFFYANESSPTVCQGVIQPTVFETSPGNLTALLRSSCGVLGQTWSSDYGQTWLPRAVPTHIANPGAGVDGANMMDQKDLGLILAFNNNTESRTPLSLAQSLDSGMTWTHIIDLETDPDGRFMYPYLFRDRFDSRVLHLCYTYQSEGNNTMAYMKLDFN